MGDVADDAWESAFNLEQEVEAVKWYLSRRCGRAGSVCEVHKATPDEDGEGIWTCPKCKMSAQT